MMMSMDLPLQRCTTPLISLFRLVGKERGYSVFVLRRATAGVAVIERCCAYVRAPDRKVLCADIDVKDGS